MEAEYGHDEVDAAVLIQSRYRGWLARKRYADLKRAAHVIQAANRAKAGREDTRSRKYLSRNGKRGALSVNTEATTVTTSSIRKPTLPDSDAVLIFGGHNPNIPFRVGNNAREIYRLNPLLNQWQLLGLLPEPRIHAGAVHFSGVVIIFGGSDPEDVNHKGKPRPSSRTWSLHLETGKWKELANMTEPKTNFGYAALNGKIFVFGGTNIDGRALDSCEAYDPQYNSWNIVTSMDSPRVSMAVTQVADKIWIAGGLTKDPRLPMLKSVIVYDVKRNSFLTAPSLPEPRCYATMTSYYDRVFIIAGAVQPNDGGATRSISEVMVLENGRWEVFGNLKTPRHGQCQAKLGKYILLMGGVTSETKLALSTVESVNLEKGTVSTKMVSIPKPLSGMAGAIVLH